MTIEATLTERQRHYGDFSERAKVEQAIVDAMQNTIGWEGMGAHHKSAARMIAVKLSRIINCDPDHVDSWHDIAGYAKLVEEAIGCRHGNMISDGKTVQCVDCGAVLPIHVA